MTDEKTPDELKEQVRELSTRQTINASGFKTKAEEGENLIKEIRKANKPSLAKVLEVLEKRVSEWRDLAPKTPQN